MQPDKQGRLVELVRCYACARERIPSGAWILLGTHCRKCSASMWRTVRHPAHDYVEYLWPDPTHVTARHFVFGAETGVMQPYCAPCAPAVGELPPHKPEYDGAPVTLGPVVDYLDSRERYANTYTPEFGRGLTAWLDDHLHLDESTAKALIALWCADFAYARRVEGAPPLRESDDGPPASA